MIKRFSTFIAVLLVLVLPNSVAASAYSPLKYTQSWLPPGTSQYASLCEQSGIVDTAQNYSQTVVKHYVASSCTGSSYSVPAGYIAAYVEGYINGGFCGSSGLNYSTVTTSAWQLWTTLCTKPSGSQTFYSIGAAVYWDGSTYWETGFTTSPSQNY